MIAAWVGQGLLPIDQLSELWYDGLRLLMCARVGQWSDLARLAAVVMVWQAGVGVMTNGWTDSNMGRSRFSLPVWASGLSMVAPDMM